jgi:hypothetical protein
MTDKIPMKRTGELSEIAALVSFIASKESSFTTGFVWDATGGRASKKLFMFLLFMFCGDFFALNKNCSILRKM